MEKLFQNQREYNLSFAQGGEEGWNRISERAPDAIILDLFMPQMDGFKLLEKLRENTQLQNIPVIVMSGGDLSPDQHRQLSDFGHRLISKSSLSEADLFDTIHRVLRGVQSGS